MQKIVKYDSKQFLTFPNNTTYISSQWFFLILAYVRACIQADAYRMIPEEKQKSGNEINKKKKKRTIERIQNKINNNQKDKQKEMQQKDKDKDKLNGAESVYEELKDSRDYIFGVYGFWIIVPTRIATHNGEVI